MFEAADKWVSSLEADEYAQFLAKLLFCCCDQGGAFLPLDDIERGKARPPGFPEDKKLIKARLNAEAKAREEARLEAERIKAEAERLRLEQIRREMEEAQARREAALLLQKQERKRQEEQRRAQAQTEAQAKAIAARKAREEQIRRREEERKAARRAEKQARDAEVAAQLARRAREAAARRREEEERAAAQRLAAAARAAERSERAEMLRQHVLMHVAAESESRLTMRSVGLLPSPALATPGATACSGLGTDADAAKCGIESSDLEEAKGWMQPAGAGLAARWQRASMPFIVDVTASVASEPPTEGGAGGASRWAEQKAIGLRRLRRELATAGVAPAHTRLVMQRARTPMGICTSMSPWSLGHLPEAGDPPPLSPLPISMPGSLMASPRDSSRNSSRLLLDLRAAPAPRPLDPAPPPSTRAPLPSSPRDRPLLPAPGALLSMGPASSPCSSSAPVGARGQPALQLQSHQSPRGLSRRLVAPSPLARNPRPSPDLAVSSAGLSSRSSLRGLEGGYQYQHQYQYQSLRRGPSHSSLASSVSGSSSVVGGGHSPRRRAQTSRGTLEPRPGLVARRAQTSEAAAVLPGQHEPLWPHRSDSWPFAPADEASRAAATPDGTTTVAAHGSDAAPLRMHTAHEIRHHDHANTSMSLPMMDDGSGAFGNEVIPQSKTSRMAAVHAPDLV